MITEVLLILPLYLTLFLIWWRFRHLIKAMTDIENMLNNDELFADTVDTPKEGVEQYKKREFLKSAISKAKVLGGKKQWTHEKVDKALGKHVISLYSTGISQMVKIRDVKKLQQDIENDSIIKDQMANLGCLLVCAFGNFLAPGLVAAHRVNNLDLDNEQQSYDNEG